MENKIKTAEEWLKENGYPQVMTMTFENIVDIINRFIHSQFTPTATEEKEIEELAEKSAGGLTNEGTTYERSEHIAGYILGYTQALQSRVVNVSDEEIFRAALKEFPYTNEGNVEDDIDAAKRNIFCMGANWLRSKLSIQSEKEMDEQLQQLLQNILKHSTDDFSYVDSESVTVADIKNEFSKLGVTVDDKTNF